MEDTDSQILSSPSAFRILPVFNAKSNGLRPQPLKIAQSGQLSEASRKTKSNLRKSCESLDKC